MLPDIEMLTRKTNFTTQLNSHPACLQTAHDVNMRNIMALGKEQDHNNANCQCNTA